MISLVDISAGWRGICHWRIPHGRQYLMSNSMLDGAHSPHPAFASIQHHLEAAYVLASDAASRLTASVGTGMPLDASQHIHSRTTNADQYQLSH